MKKIIQYFGHISLFLAGFVILAHSIIPHHHHLQSVKDSNSCEQKCDHDEKGNSVSDIFSLNTIEHDDPLCDGCHFNIEVTNTFEKFSLNLQCSIRFNLTQLIVPENEMQAQAALSSTYCFLFSSGQTSRGPPSSC